MARRNRKFLMGGPGEDWTGREVFFVVCIALVGAFFVGLFFGWPTASHDHEQQFRGACAYAGGRVHTLDGNKICMRDNGDIVHEDYAKAPR